MAPRHKDSDRKNIMGETRKRLLQAAVEEFSLHGYAGANVNRIAASAGYSIGTFYNYFPTKQDLMFGFIDEIGGKHVDFIQEVVLDESNPEDRLKAFFDAGFSFVQDHPMEARGIFNTLNGPDDGFRARLFQVYGRLFSMLNNEILGPGAGSGSFRQDLPGSTAGLIMLIYLGVGSQLTPEGQHWLEAGEVADFVSRAIRVVHE
jgi:AcrR family transcriptional regulator